MTCDDARLTSSRDGVDVRRVVERVGDLNSCFGGGDVPVAPWILECLTGWGLCGHRYPPVGSSRTPSHRCKHGSALDPGGYVLSCPCCVATGGSGPSDGRTEPGKGSQTSKYVGPVVWTGQVL
jgi:hypothetical protein